MLVVHEWSLASGIVKSIEDECRRQSVSGVSSVELAVGELSQIEVRALRQALEELRKGTVMGGCKIRILREKTRFRCSECGHSWPFSKSKQELEPLEKGGDNAVHYLPSTVNAFIRCPRCGSPDFQIASGLALSIRKVLFDRMATA